MTLQLKRAVSISKSHNRRSHQHMQVTGARRRPPLPYIVEVVSENGNKTR